MEIVDPRNVFNTVKGKMKDKLQNKREGNPQ